MDVPFKLVICRIKETNEEMYLITKIAKLRFRYELTDLLMETVQKSIKTK